MGKKVQKTYVDTGLGFPVTLRNVPMVKVRGEWVADINYNSYMRAVLLELPGKKGALTGSEVRFVRQYLKLTLEKFAFRFNVSHAAVLKWEKAGNKATRMGWSTEKDLRLFVLRSVLIETHKKSQGKTAEELLRLYESLECPLTASDAELEIDAGKIAA